MDIILPYGNTGMRCTLPDHRLQCVLENRLDTHFTPPLPPEETVRDALRHPVGSPPLQLLAQGKNYVEIIASDHTRPVPSRLLIPQMISEIRRGNPEARITILVATGCHRGMTREEMLEKFGEPIVSSQRIVVHDCDDPGCVGIGTLPSGGRCRINRLAAEADLLVSEGFIEPHFFAGFSGGRKSVMPGVASRETVLYNHYAKFIDHLAARTGVLKGNPIHEDMLWAARQARLAFIVNVVLNSRKELIYAVAGDAEQAHRAGCDFLTRYCGVSAPPADIVIATNGGYPLDQNIYQAAKGISTAEAAVKPGGVILMLAESGDGHGGEDYYRQFRDHPDLEALLAQFLSRCPEATEPDQWQTQIQIRALRKARIVYISEADEGIVRDMHMIPAKSVEEGLRAADALLGHESGTITVIPDAVSVVFR